MKTIYKSNFLNSLIGLLVCINFITVNISAQDTPPIPKEPSSMLQYPRPVLQGEMQGRAVLPEKISQGFALDLAEKVLTGNWDIQGKISAIEKGDILLKTNEQKTGRFVYRLPKGIVLPLKVDQQISIRRTVKGYEATLGYIMRVDSNNNIVLSSGRIFGNSALEAKIFGGLSLKQVSDQENIVSDSKFEKIYNVPISLMVNNETKPLPIGEPYEFNMNDRTFLVIVNESSKVIPAKAYEATSEGKGYTLEYAIMLK